MCNERGGSESSGDGGESREKRVAAADVAVAGRLLK